MHANVIMGGLEFRSSVIMHKYENTLPRGGRGGALWALSLHVKYIFEKCITFNFGFHFWCLGLIFLFSQI